eukprot:EG_transcript_2448
MLTIVVLLLSWTHHANQNAFAAAASHQSAITYHNVLSLLSPASPTTATIDSQLLAANLSDAATRCGQCQGPSPCQSCQLLANLCVLQLLDTSGSACEAYQQLILANTSCTDPTKCDVPAQLPPLYFNQEPQRVLLDGSLNVSASAGRQLWSWQHLKLIATRYTWDGHRIGSGALLHELDLCGIPDYSVYQVSQLGFNHLSRCYLTVRPIVHYTPSEFIEFSLEDDEGQVVPVPMLLRDDASDDVLDLDYFSEGLTQALTSQDLPTTLARRAFLYDNVAGLPVGQSAQQYIRLAQDVALLVSLRPDTDGRIYTPLVVLRYATRLVPTASAENVSLRTDSVGDAITAPMVRLRSVYTMPSEPLWRGTWAAFVAATCLACPTALWLTAAWVRRHPASQWDTAVVPHAVAYFAGHAAFLCFILLLVSSGYCFVAFKFESTMKFLLPIGMGTLGWILPAALGLQALRVLHLLWQQTHCDVFLVDCEPSWSEVPRASLPADIPVSLWRSVLVMNHLNAIQAKTTLRLAALLLVFVTFMTAGRLEGLANAQPNFGDLDGIGASAHPVLRFFVACFFLLLMRFAFQAYDALLHYRFLAVDPVQQLVDLCCATNISLFALVDPHWGYYLHGHSLHPHADTDLKAFYEGLQQEAEGYLPERGLIPDSQLQTFEVLWGAPMALLWRRSLARMRELRHVLEPPPDRTPHATREPSRCFYLTSARRRRFPLLDEEVQAHQCLSDSLVRLVDRAGDRLQEKTFLHRYLGLPPTLVDLLAAPEGDEPGAIFFADWGRDLRCLFLLGIQGHLFLLYMLFYTMMDFLLVNTYAAAVLTYVLHVTLVAVRRKAGEMNLASKSLLDERFLI